MVDFRPAPKRLVDPYAFRRRSPHPQQAGGTDAKKGEGGKRFQFTRLIACEICPHLHENYPARLDIKERSRNGTDTARFPSVR